MSGDRVKQIYLITAFIVAICSAGLSQLVFDLVEGKTPQAAELLIQKPTKANLTASYRYLSESCGSKNLDFVRKGRAQARKCLSPPMKP